MSGDSVEGASQTGIVQQSGSLGSGCSVQRSRSMPKYVGHLHERPRGRLLIQNG